MHRSVRLPALAAVTALTALMAAPAGAQTVTGPTNGFFFNSGTQTFADPSFDYAYSFRARQFTPSAVRSGQLLGAQGTGSPAGSPCVVGEGCQTTSSPPGFTPGNGTYTFTLNFGSGTTAPQFSVTRSGTASLALAPLGAIGGISPAFFLQLSGSNGALTLSNLQLNGTAFGGSIGTTGTAQYYRIDAAGDLSNAVLTGTVTTAGLTGGSQESPRFEFYVGSTAVVPEPSTYALMGTGLAGLLAVARRRRTA